MIITKRANLSVFISDRLAKLPALILSRISWRSQESPFSSLLKETTISSTSYSPTRFRIITVRTHHNQQQHNYYPKLNKQQQIEILIVRVALIKEIMLVETDPKLYFFIAQGMITIDNVDDAEEMRATDEAFNILNFSQV